MQLYRTLVLFATLSAACGLRCFTCTAAEPKSCTDSKSCAIIFDRCYSLKIDGAGVTKGCQNSAICGGPMSCCEGDLCNSAFPSGPSVILLLVTTSSILTFIL